MLHDHVLNRGDRKIKPKHMSRQAFSYCLSTSKRYGFTINQVPLFGPIVGEVFVEEEELGHEDTGAGNEEVHEEPEGPTMVILEEPAHDTQQETVQQSAEPVIEPVIEPASTEESDNVFEEILREEAQQSLEQTSQSIKTYSHYSLNIVITATNDTYAEIHHQELPELPFSALGSTILSQKRERSDEDSESDDEEAQSLRAKKGKEKVIEQPKKKKSRAELDENILVERQRKGFELRTSSTPPVTATKSSDLSELKDQIKKMDARITSQAKIIRVQNARIDEQDEIIKDMHTLISYQGNQIDSIFEALARFSNDKRDDKDADDDDDADKFDKNKKEDTTGDKDAGGESTYV